MDTTGYLKCWKFCAAILMLAAVGGQAHAASAVNLDNEPRTLIVTEGDSKTELALSPPARPSSSARPAAS